MNSGYYKTLVLPVLCYCSSIWDPVGAMSPTGTCPGMRRHFRRKGGCSYVFSEVVSFSLGLLGMSLKEEQLSAIKAVYEVRA